MKHRSRIFIAASLLALLSACSGGEYENQTASAANEVAPTDNMAAMANDPNNPFAAAEMRMSEQMMSAVGSDVGDNWVRKMIVHHQGAVDMSRIVLEQSPTADVAEMARMTIEKQQKEIGDLEKLRKEGAPDQESAELYRPSMMDMHQKMQAATGANVSETFMRKMLEHHRGAVAMSDIALRDGVSGALRPQIQKTRDDQQKEAEMVEAMLAGTPIKEAMSKSGAKPAPKEEAASPAAKAPAQTAPAAPRVAPKAAPKAEHKATAGAEAKATPTVPAAAPACAPEHRAAGHC